MKVTYAALSAAFADVKGRDIKTVGQIVGGMVEYNINNGFFTNACAIRLSYALNKAGVKIPYIKNSASSGANKKWYMYRIEDVEKFVKGTLSIINIHTGVSSSDFNGKHGIIVFRDCGWSDAAGHVDLYNGNKVEDHDYSTNCHKVTLYELP
jgi:hypothetical protein